MDVASLSTSCLCDKYFIIYKKIIWLWFDIELFAVKAYYFIYFDFSMKKS